MDSQVNIRFKLKPQIIERVIFSLIFFGCLAILFVLLLMGSDVKNISAVSILALAGLALNIIVILSTRKEVNFTAEKITSVYYLKKDEEVLKKDLNKIVLFDETYSKKAFRDNIVISHSNNRNILVPKKLIAGEVDFKQLFSDITALYGKKG